MASLLFTPISSKSLSCRASTNRRISGAAFQGSLKRTRIRNNTTYNLEFQLQGVPEYLHLPILSEPLGISEAAQTLPPVVFYIPGYSKIADRGGAYSLGTRRT
ncbi:hypothetical protein CJF31_00001413 [Rutstroemia sp. NJR-2017a BVV2]|nr:hypothetical protein CJF31_00001413 [Rutstroemia sp. NJR-2017a BVV2]